MLATEVTRPDGAVIVSMRTDAGLASVYRAADGYMLRTVEGEFVRSGFRITGTHVAEHAGQPVTWRPVRYVPKHAR